MTIPVLVYNAVEETEHKVSFNLLHKESWSHGYDKKCRKCNKVLSSEEIVKGYKYEPEQYVIVEKEDLDRINLKSTKIIKSRDSSMQRKSTRHCMSPLTTPARTARCCAVQVLQTFSRRAEGDWKGGIGKVVLHDREDVVMIAPSEKVIVLYKLRSPREIRNNKDVPLLEEKAIDKEGLKLARTLVDSMSTTLDNIDLTDKYHDALRAIIDAKIAAGRSLRCRRKKSLWWTS